MSPRPWLVMALLAAGPAAAQTDSTSLLHRTARLDITDMALGAALTALQRESGVSIAFSGDLLPPGRTVSCRCRNVTVQVALARILEGTGLGARVTRTQIVVTPPPNGRRTISGQVLDRTDRSPVPAARVDILDTPISAVSDANGRFVLGGAPPAGVRVRVRRLGFAADTVFVPSDRNTVTVAVATETTELDPVLVTGAPPAEWDRFEHDAQTSTVTLDGQQVAAIPGLLEADVVRAVQTMPGVVARSDYSVGYNVRGGENDQNLVLLDGITVFNPTHVGGLFSSFDANAVESFDFMSGGFPSRFSGRLSSVLDMRVREGRRTGLGARGQVSLLSSKVLLDGPIGPATFVLGGRRTYADAVISAVSNQEVPYHFSDLIGKLTLPLGDDGSIAVTAYASRDVLDVDEFDSGSSGSTFEFDWGNRVAGATWSQLVGRGTATAHASVSEFDANLAISPDLVRHRNAIRLWTARAAYDVPIGYTHRVTAGAGFERFDATFAFEQAAFALNEADVGNTPFLPLFNRSYQPDLWSAFVEDQWRAADRVLVRPGLRVEHIPRAGFTGIAPRLSFKVYVGARDAISGSLGRYYQGVHSLRDQDVPISVYEFWIAATDNVPVGRSDQVVLGYERWFGRDWQLVVEGYWKDYDDLIIPNRALALRDQGSEFLPMDGRSWGADVWIRRHIGRVRGWLGYGFNHASRRANGATFPPSHDRRHTLNLVLEAPGPLGADFGLRWAYGSPLPFTAQIGTWRHRRFNIDENAFEVGDIEPVSVGINNARYPNYQRLDVGLRWRAGMWGAVLRPYLQVANAYNRRNVFLYADDFTPRPSRQAIYQLPIVVTFGLEFSW